MEGFLQSLKFEKVHIQIEVCKLVGLSAKYRGKKRNKAWKQVQCLWWNGVAIPRHSKEYQELLTEAFDEISKNNSFRHALIASGDSVLTHSIGSSDPSHTVLTEREFCRQLTRVRTQVERDVISNVRNSKFSF
jgi:hypothetical protein